jgi:hypothetical protein
MKRGNCSLPSLINETRLFSYSPTSMASVLVRLAYSEVSDLKRLRVMIHRLKGSQSGEHPLQADEARGH